MSLQHLKELGDQILKAAESSPLQAEIARLSLESMHATLVSNSDQPQPQEDFAQIPQQPMNMFVDNPPAIAFPTAQPVPVSNYMFDEQVVPAVIGPQYNTEIMTQANSIPFLYHQMPDNQ